ncbi:MAG: hypothetical protein ACI4OO_01295 [Otoolea sp.]
MMNIQTAEHILSDNEKLATGMRKYKKIMDFLYWTDVSADKDFQRAFNSFFVMRSRSNKYYDMFYSFLERKKDKGVSFEETLDYLKEAEGQLEISFSSKLIHVINPHRPIWDKIVAENHFNMKLPGYGGDTSTRQKEVVKLYHEYCSRFYEYLDSADGQTILRLFNEKYPHTGFTDAKKMDFIMWVDG